MSGEIMLQKIQKAQIEIDDKKALVKNGKMRQHYHFMPQTGWMNDPNGLIFIKENITSFSNIIHMMDSGEVCTGDMLSVRI